MFRVFFALLLLLGFALPAEAELRLAVWAPPGFRYPYVVPVREGETLAHAVGRYQGALNMSRGIRGNLLPQAVRIPVGRVTDLRREPPGPRAIIPANKYADLRPEQEYLDKPGKLLRRRGIRPYVLPIAGAELGLSEGEAAEARRAIRDQFDLYVGIGGDDISPRLYGKRRSGARGDISYARDAAESRLVAEYVRGHGFSGYLCRAHQMLGVTMGCELVQDIPTELGVDIHGRGIHKIRIDAGESEHLAKIFPGLDELWVNSLHHESIGPGGNGLLRVVARDLHGVVEAVELPNGLGVQFHPELMHGKVRDPFFDYLAARARLAYRRRAHGGGRACAAGFARLGAGK